MVFSLDRIGDAHLWHDIHIASPAAFASDALVDAINEAGLTGFAGSRKEAMP